MKAVVRGPLLSMSGYGNHAREVYRWLEEKEGVDIVTQILPWGVTPWHVNPDALGGMVNRIMRKSVPLNTEQNIDISFQVQLPNEWDHNLARFNVGVTAAVETDICNPHWVQCCNRMNLIIVPTNFTKKTLQETMFDQFDEFCDNMEDVANQYYQGLKEPGDVNVESVLDNGTTRGEKVSYDGRTEYLSE